MNQKNQIKLSCRIFKEQMDLINNLPEKDRANVLYLAINNAFCNQLDIQVDIQVDNQDAIQSYLYQYNISVYKSLSELSKSVLNIFYKTIEAKDFSNWGGKRTGAGKRPKKPSAKPSGKPKKNLAENENVNVIINKLEDILFKYHNRHFETKSWADSIDKMLRLDEVSFDDVIKNLDWYSEHIGEKYIPVIESGKSLREKYTKLENAVKREKPTTEYIPQNWSWLDDRN